jgi:hypothetical protein
MRVLSIVAGAFVFGTLVLSAQDESQKLVLNSYWQAGTKLELVLEEERIVNGESWGRFRTPVTVQVLAGSTKGYIVAWKYGRAEMQGAGPGKSLGERRVNLLRECTLQLHTDPYGKVEALANPGQVRTLVARRKRSLFRWLDGQALPADEQKSVRNGVNALCDPDTLSMRVVHTPVLYFLPSGRTFVRGKLQRYDDRMYNPWGWEPFPCKAQLRLISADSAKRLATLRWKQSLDARKAKAIVKRTAAELARRAEGRPLPDRKLPRVQVNEKAEYRYDTETGFPVHLRYVGTGRFGEERIISRITITGSSAPGPAR